MKLILIKFNESQANPMLYYIDAGMQNRFIPDAWTKMNLTVSKVIVNSKFSWNTIQDDIALVKLQVSEFFIIKLEKQ